MRLEAPLSVELVGLNDWSYYEGLDCWLIDWLRLEVGWPPSVVFKILGLGFRFEVSWGRNGFD